MMKRKYVFVGVIIIVSVLLFLSIVVVVNKQLCAPQGDGESVKYYETIKNDFWPKDPIRIEEENLTEGCVSLNGEIIITEDVYFYEEYIRMPLLAVLEYCGVQINWISENTAKLECSGKNFFLDLSNRTLFAEDDNFNILQHAPGIMTYYCETKGKDIIVDGETFGVAWGFLETEGIWLINDYSNCVIRLINEDIEIFFQQDKEDLYVVFDYLRNLEYELIRIDNDMLKKGIMFTGANTQEQEIENEKVINSLKNLLSSRVYFSVGKKDDTVYFEICWLFEKVRGIAVPINKDQKPMVEFLVKYEPLSEDGWYYYEADYEEYRQLH